jgi:nicotinic acid mononucleotide adenylyltransferase/nicotinamide mononucleotide (NMN) deamidase PncC
MNDDSAFLTAGQLVERIHGANARFVLAVTGGGGRAIAELLQVPGASRTVLEAVVPYSEAAMVEWLSGRPDQFCAEPTGRAMAMAAYHRACRWSADASSRAPLAGVACTASLASDRPKRGPHRVHVAIQTARATVSRSVELVKGRRTRAQEEQAAAWLVLNAVAQACGLEDRLAPGLLSDEPVGERQVIAPQAWQELLAGRVQTVRHGGAGEEAAAPARALFPGAFHPIHAGHRRMAEIARQKLGVPVQFEISVHNVDKPPLDFIEIDDRLAQFAPQDVVWLTRAATFEEKSARFPGATFVVGVDTLRRIADARYHGRDPAAWHAAMERIAARGCRFLVFGRRHEGRFVGLGDLDLHPLLRNLCQKVPADEFCEDVSSTEIRQRT